MTHATYLERYVEITTAALAELALMHGRGDFAEATTYLTQLRAGLDALWEQFKDAASAGVNP